MRVAAISFACQYWPDWTSRQVNQPPLVGLVSMHAANPRSFILPVRWGLWPQMIFLPDLVWAYLIKEFPVEQPIRLFFQLYFRIQARPAHDLAHRGYNFGAHGVPALPFMRRLLNETKNSTFPVRLSRRRLTYHK